MATCPFCRGRVTRAEHASSGGKRAFSLCCGVSLNLIDNYEVLTGVPESLRQAIIEQDRQHQAEIIAREQEKARHFLAAQAEFKKRPNYLFKGE